MVCGSSFLGVVLEKPLAGPIDAGFAGIGELVLSDVCGWRWMLFAGLWGTKKNWGNLKKT